MISIPCVLQFQVDCIRDKKKLGLEIDHLRKDDNMSLQDHQILDWFELTKFKDPTVFEDLSVVLATFWNHCQMISGLISSDHGNVTEERLLSFLFLYALIEDKDILDIVEDGNDSSSLSLEDVESLDPFNDDDCESRKVESGYTVLEEDGNHRTSDMLLFQHSICRDCKITYESADDPYCVCDFITRSDIAGKEKDELQSFGFHRISNAFDDICFGARNLGIYGSSPSEPLHLFKLGLCNYLYEGFICDVHPTTVDLIDEKIARMISRGLHQSINDLSSLQVLRKGLNGCRTLGGDDQMSRIYGIQL